MRAAITTLSTLLAWTLLAGSAAAQDSAEQARQLFEAGVASMDRGQVQQAATYFDQSYRLFPRAPTACNMAVAQERLGRACDAQQWYRQCAALDRTGRFSDHANRQAAALGLRCQAAPQPPPHDPFVRTAPPPPPPPPPPAALYNAAVQRMSAPGPNAGAPAPDHGLLIGGIAAFLIGGGAIGGGAAAALEAQALTATLSLSVPSGDLVENTPEAELWYRASTFSDVALSLYIGGGLVAGLGALLIIIDLAQPGVFGPSARRGDGPQLAFRPALGGGLGELSLGF